jgi:hypothetical protein
MLVTHQGDGTNLTLVAERVGGLISDQEIGTESIPIHRIRDIIAP